MRAGRRLARLAGAFVLAGLGLFASAGPGYAQNGTACDAAWKTAAEKRAADGLEMLQALAARERVRLWRLLTLGEDQPVDSDSGNEEGPFLPADFPDDPQVSRIQAMIADHRLDAAAAEIAALTHIPDPAAADAAAEHVLVRNELLFSAILWSSDAYWAGTEPVSGSQELAQYWMARLDAHFLSLPLAILNSDEMLYDAYWRAVRDLRWFLRSDQSPDIYSGRQADDWWLPDGRTMPELGGVKDAIRDSDLLDWLQTTEEVRALGARPWIQYLSSRVTGEGYSNAARHAHTKAETTKALHWQIAAGLWWIHGLPSGLDSDRNDGSGPVDAMAKDLMQRSTHCDLSIAEQYALGPLRYHSLRIESLTFASPRFGPLWWDDRASPEELNAADPVTRGEIVRFSFLAGDADQARKMGNVPPELRALLAQDLDSFIAAKPDPSAINLLPLRLLVQIIEKSGLEPGFRAAVARLAWTRAWLLGDTDILKRVTPTLGATNPPLKPYIDAYESAWTDEGRHHAALLLLLKSPAMQVLLPDPRDVSFGWGPDRADMRPQIAGDALFKVDYWNHNDNNWWCRLDIEATISGLQSNFYDRPLQTAEIDNWGNASAWGYSQSLQVQIDSLRDWTLSRHAILRQIDWEELGRLAKVPNAPAYLSREMVTWARSSWWDRTFHADLLAEALATAVRAGRYGCNRDGPNGDASNAAFRALHQLFPHSAAAMTTPYWYN